MYKWVKLMSISRLIAQEFNKQRCLSTLVIIIWDSHASDPIDPLGLLSLLVEQPRIEFVACKHGECVKLIRDVQPNAGSTAA